MLVDYLYCNFCGYEAFDLWVVYSRQTANGSWYICPCCGEEVSDVEVEEY